MSDASEQVQRVMREIDTANRDFTDFKESTSRALEEKQNILLGKYKILQELISKGGTTGDHIRDLVFKLYCRPDPDLEQRYRVLEAALVGKKGEFFLIDFHAPVCTRISMTHTDYYHREFFRLGVLDGEQLLIDYTFYIAPAITVPVSSYVGDEASSVIMDEKDVPDLQVIERNIFTPLRTEAEPPHLESFLEGEAIKINNVLVATDLPMWYRPRASTHLLGRVEPQPIGLYVGDEAVKGWLERHLKAALYKPAADALRKLILEPTEP